MLGENYSMTNCSDEIGNIGILFCFRVVSQIQAFFFITLNYT